jgi:hypothetical protein
MSNFAKVIDGVVIDIIVAEQDFVDTLPDKNLWVQTSFGTIGNIHYKNDLITPDDGIPFRKNYAKIGGYYDSVNDGFYEKQPFPSWKLNPETFLWEAPILQPIDKSGYRWKEDTQSWQIDPL